MTNTLSKVIKENKDACIIGSAATIEVLSQVFFIHINAYIFSAIYFLSGLIIGYTTLQLRDKINSAPTQWSIKPIWQVAFTGLIIMLFADYSKELFKAVPIDYKTADMLPIINIMAERFISGEEVYAIIPEIWGGMQPIYLPSMWMPFIPSVLLDFDMRWISIIGLSIVLIVLCVNNHKNSHPIQIVSCFLSAIIIIGIVSVDSSLITMTEEPVVILWYILLCLSIYSRSIWSIGICIGLCLLSRYALAPWVLLYGGTLLYNRRITSFTKVMTVSILCVLSLMMATGAIFHLDIFWALESNYLRDIIQQKDKYHWMIHSSLGLAKYFPYEHLSVLHQIMKVVSVVIPLICGLWYISQNKKPIFQWFAIGSLKLCLVFFFNLLIMPYSYLFYTSTFVSLFILSHVSNSRRPN